MQSRLVLRARWVAAGILLGLVGTACGGDAVAPEREVQRVEVSPAQGTLLVGEDLALAASAFDADGRLVDDRAVQWTSSDVSVATVAADGVVTAKRAGGAFIRATVDGIVAAAPIVVTEPTVVSIELSRVTLSLEAGEQSVLTAVPKDALGRDVVGRTALWASVDPAVATVDAAGIVTGLEAGETSVVVTIDGRSATVRVTVTTPPVADVVILGAGAVVEVGEFRQFAAQARDARGRPIADRPVTWVVNAPAARISPTGMLIGVRPGVVSIRATIEGVAGAIDVRVVASEPLDADLLYHRPLSDGRAQLMILSGGAGVAPFTVNAGDVSRQPSPSPNGNRIVFAVSMTELGTARRVDDLFAVDRNGLNMRQLTSMPGEEFDPAWSPSGDRIAFVHRALSGRQDIWVMNADGTGAQNLTADMADVPQQTHLRAAPAWSPDGTRLVFQMYEWGELPQPAQASLIVMQADGSGKRAITSTTTGFDMQPSWSPDGTTIAFSRYYAGGDADISLVPATGGAVTRLPRAGGQTMPAWSPDGSWIAFVQGDIGRDNVYTMRPDGSTVRLQTVDPQWGGGLSPAWIRR